MAFVTFMSSAAGRALGIVAGLTLIVGLAVVGATGGVILAVVGLIPLGAGAAALAPVASFRCSAATSTAPRSWPTIDHRRTR